MTESLPFGIPGDEDEKPEVETHATLAGAEAPGPAGSMPVPRARKSYRR